MGCFNNVTVVRYSNSSSTFYSYLSEEIKHSSSDMYAHMMNPYQKLMDEYITKSNESTVLEEIYGKLKQYIFTLAVYFMIIVIME